MLGGFKSSASVLEKEKLPVKEKSCVLLSFCNVNTVKTAGRNEWRGMALSAGDVEVTHARSQESEVGPNN